MAKMHVAHRPRRHLRSLTEEERRELAATIRTMATAGISDMRIAAHLGRGVGWIRKIRRAYDIDPATVAVGRLPRSGMIQFDLVDTDEL
jgi:hypothetical protein